MKIYKLGELNKLKKDELGEIILNSQHEYSEMMEKGRVFNKELCREKEKLKKK